MAKIEELTFGSQKRASIDQELQTLEPEELFPKFDLLNIEKDKMKEFVKNEYLRVLDLKKSRVNRYNEAKLQKKS